MITYIDVYGGNYAVKAETRMMVAESFANRYLRVIHIDGLGSTPVAISSYDRTSTAGGVDITSARKQPRNVVITISTEEAPSVDAGRYVINRVFQPGESVELRIKYVSPFMNETYILNGMVESSEHNVFGEDPLSQVSILCPTPNIRLDKSVGSEISLNPGRLLRTLFNYPGYAPSGIIFEATRADATESMNHQWMLETRQGDSTLIELKVNLSDYPTAEYLKINTTPGERRVEVRDSFGTHNATGKILPGSGWPMALPIPNGQIVARNRPSIFRGTAKLYAELMVRGI